MLTCFSSEKNKNIIDIDTVKPSDYLDWLKDQSRKTDKWLRANTFIPNPGEFAIIPDDDGSILKVLFIQNDNEYTSYGTLSTNLPKGTYAFTNDFDNKELQNIAIAWAMGAYVFGYYAEKPLKEAKLFVPNGVNQDYVNAIANAIYLVRNLINTPAEDMGPADLAEMAETVVKNFGADFTEYVGKDLIKENYPAIHAVGRASNRAPRLIDIKWGDPAAPKITLVGKGVCFDTGGLDLKPPSGMITMKKDMGGAAHVLALATVIMSLNIPIRLRVLIPAVENSVSGGSLRPSDIINTRRGITVEIKNTDAEGRLVLCDALAEAASDNPELIIDMATLTGAARAALGTDIAAFFTNDEDVASAMNRISVKEQDLLWRLPLHAGYRSLLDSNVAGISNVSLTSSSAGAVLAALFLKEFVPDNIPWMHFDIMAWNLSSKPGKPEGGDAICIRALTQYLLEHFG